MHYFEKNVCLLSTEPDVAYSLSGRCLSLMNLFSVTSDRHKSCLLLDTRFIWLNFCRRYSMFIFNQFDVIAPKLLNLVK